MLNLETEEVCSPLSQVTFLRAKVGTRVTLLNSIGNGMTYSSDNKAAPKIKEHRDVATAINSSRRWNNRPVRQVEISHQCAAIQRNCTVNLRSLVGTLEGLTAKGETNRGALIGRQPAPYAGCNLLAFAEYLDNTNGFIGRNVYGALTCDVGSIILEEGKSDAVHATKLALYRELNLVRLFKGACKLSCAAN